VWFRMIRKMVICLDDIERRGKNLSVRDVLGLVSSLKERKGCKICLILNDEALEEDKKDFDAYFEKVVDTSLSFVPTPTECAHIALSPGQKVQDLVRGNCIKLGISNIRLIKKIERAALRLEELVIGLADQVLIQAIPSLAVLGWSLYDRNSAPSLEFLRQRGSLAALTRQKKGDAVLPQEAAWNALLDAYRWSGFDEFDEVLLDGIRDGYFELARVQKYAADIDAKAKAARSTNAFIAAWDRYHDSFENNQDEVLDAIYEGFREGVRYISPVNLNGTVWLLKELGRHEQAAQIIKLYVEAHGGDPALFDVDRSAFAGMVDQPEVVEAFRTKSASFIRNVDVDAVLLSMAGRNGWTAEDITTLAAVLVDDYCKIFKRYSGKQLHDILNVCLQFDRVAGATAEMREISKRAKEALTRIGGESAINATRVRKYGVEPVRREVEPVSAVVPLPSVDEG